MTTLRKLLVHWKSLVIVLAPLVLLPLLILGHKEAKCGFVVLLMSIYWMTEAIPLPVTSLLPVVLYPLFGVLGTEEVCKEYLRETNMMFIGGLIVAIAVEHCNLHKRIALKVILIIGTSPMKLMLGFMSTTMVLSMWISNTATTAMMAPIVQAVLDELKMQRDLQNRQRLSQHCVNTADSDEASGVFDPETRRKSICKIESEQLARPDPESICYYLGVAYASNLGGAGTLTGTGTNLTFKGIWDSAFCDSEDINFASWMIFNVPLMLINCLVCWLWLQILFLGLWRKCGRKNNSDNAKMVKDLIKEKFEELGPMNFHEASILFLFIITVLLWFFRKPEFIPGWVELAPSVRIKDATPVMLIVFLLFVLPSNLDFLHYFVSKDKRPGKPAPSLLTWKVIHEKVPWGLVLLLGGGFAMAAGSKKSGLSQFIGEKLVLLKGLPPVAIMIIISLATAVFTEVSSNTAVANIILPVLLEMAVSIGQHPLYFMLPAVLCCSYAFMLPVSTPPNAIVMAASNMRTTDMLKAGIGMNILCLAILFILFPTFGSLVYGLDSFPEYAIKYNISRSANMTCSTM